MKIKTYEKYTHTNQDKLDDMYYIEEFSKKFEDLFEYWLDFEVYEDIKFRDYLGYGAEKVYTGEVKIGKKMKPYMIWIETDINPNGIKGEDDIGRTYVIKMEIKVVGYSVSNFYKYSRNMEDVLEKFDRYLLEDLNLLRISDEEKERRKKERILRKDVDKYNL
jgi:hypothetical protein